jgi:hypothetical protein
VGDGGDGGARREVCALSCVAAFEIAFSTAERCTDGESGTGVMCGGGLLEQREHGTNYERGDIGGGEARVSQRAAGSATDGG